MPFQRMAVLDDTRGNLIQRRTGVGEIGGRIVACITPRWLVTFHTDYAVDATDRADVSAARPRSKKKRRGPSVLAGTEEPRRAWWAKGAR